MNKPYVEILADIYKEFHKTIRSQEEKIIEQFDKIIVWIVGLSTGAIVLIVTSSDKIKALDKDIVDIVSVLLVISITAGIISRITSAICSYNSSSFAASFDFGLKMVDFPHNPRILNGKETSEEIYYCLETDFKIQMPSLLEEKHNSSKETWDKIDEKARAIYLDYQKFSSEHLEEAKKEIDKLLISSYGFDDTKSINPNQAKRKLKFNNRLLTATYILYCISALMFTASLIFLVIKFIQ